MGDGGADEVFVLGSDLGTTVVRQQGRYALARERLIIVTHRPLGLQCSGA